ncbi:tRNA(Ile)-lysidine synthase [Planktothrix tepida]|uniref:tRNA(Ile)-lysidine synthase n=2 Tax=Planktothrix TaxID=54304 RepID=A0A1J1LN52_9CYAN|nr:MULTISPECIES: tRNA lysidine(34) synthetase TilS [Planktothrix]CAD5936184.1 tRNA(Ile)-lysidine synthase [Planktothrix tepida]CAD5975328.1 tRNA(Ile)-lysidine synthase [Planktothrix pseudagardhii]CUR33418.1 tRNA(Ile)-lysidine synthase [Planktothrix tepida PCC 9214]
MSNSLIWTFLHSQLHQTLRDRQLLPQSQRLLVAVSGGQDSVCLLKLLLDLQPKWGWELGVVYCDHRWRSDSGANGDYIAHLAESWQLPFYRRVATEIPNSEATARQWRYQVLAEIAEEYHYPVIVTGHTKSDRAETLLYNLIRGSGSDGLQALTWQRSLHLESPILKPDLTASIQLVRPLLEISREQTGQFCQEHHLKIWVDTTNEDLHYARNRIRQELLPYLQTHFNPQVESHLAQTAELLRAEVDYLDSLTETLFQQVVVFEKESQKPLKINRLILRQTHEALQRRVSRKILQQVMSKTPNFEHIEKLKALISAPNCSQTDPFPGGVIAFVDKEWIVFNFKLS